MNRHLGAPKHSLKNIAATIKDGAIVERYLIHSKADAGAITVILISRSCWIMLCLYVNALIYETSPYNEGSKGLRDATKQISADAKLP